MDNIEKYQQKLIIMSLMVGNQDEIVSNIENNKELQEYYILPETLEIIKEVIIESSERSFIDLKMKRKIIEYLDFFRDINTILNKETKKEILKKINDCIVLCNSLDSNIDNKVFYANQLYERSLGWINLDECYKYVFNSNTIETINLSIFNDLYFFNQFLNEKPYINFNLQVYNDEFALWSINHLLNDIPEIIKNKNFYDNCKLLIKCMKKNKIAIYKESGIKIGNRIKKETKNLQKRLG